MQESQVVLGWIRRGEKIGRMEARRTTLLELVRLRLQDPVPELIQLVVESANDEDTLRRWFRAAATAHTLAEFIAAMRQLQQP
jgi:hypothetical protein